MCFFGSMCGNKKRQQVIESIDKKCGTDNDFKPSIDKRCGPDNGFKHFIDKRCGPDSEPEVELVEESSQATYQARCSYTKIAPPLSLPRHSTAKKETTSYIKTQHSAMKSSDSSSESSISIAEAPVVVNLAPARQEGYC